MCIAVWGIVKLTRSSVQTPNPCLNNEIHMLFKHVFYLKRLKTGRGLFAQHKWQNVAARNDNFVHAFVDVNNVFDVRFCKLTSFCTMRFNVWNPGAFVCFIVLTFARSLERWFEHLAAALCSNNFLGTWQMLMHEKTWVIPIWAASWQNQQNDCAPSEDSDQPTQPSLCTQWVAKDPSFLHEYGQRRL